jgi:transcriptional regulator with XRE-family HTH domain
MKLRTDSLDCKNLLQGFVNRLQEVIGRESLRSFGRRTGISDGAIHHYLNRGSEPTLTRLISMARAADVNLLWLATGEGPMRHDQVNEQGAPDDVVRPLDLDLLAEAIELVEAETTGKTAAWKARMVVAIYDLGDIPREKKAALVRAAG